MVGQLFDSSMKYLIIVPECCSFLSPAATAQLIDNALQYAEQGHEVTVTYCDDSSRHYCFTNTDCSKGVCKMCRSYLQTILSSREVRRHKDIRWIAYKDNGLPFPTFEYASMEDIKKLKFKGVSIGYAAYSTFLSSTRNLYPKINPEFRAYFDKLLGIACKYTDFTLGIIENDRPDLICSINSRSVCSRPLWDISRMKGIQYDCWEGAYNRSNQYCKLSFGNSTPHDPETNRRVIEEKWNKSRLPLADRIKVGEDFFQKRRNSIPSGDKLYVKDQVQGLLPEGFDPAKHNILILNSSEDEYAALYEEYVEGIPFRVQYPGIKYIAESLSDDSNYHLYLRIHPNLKGISYLYHTKLYELAEKNPNLTVIPPDSPVSTYSLIDACEKVMVFGSTTGPEATYWGKPVILMSNCAYPLINVSYTPRTPEEVIELVKTPDLPPKDRLQAIKFGYYYLNDENEGYKYFHPYRDHKKLLGRSFDYHKLEAGPLRSKWLILLQTAGKYFYYKHLDYPQEEDPALYE